MSLEIIPKDSETIKNPVRQDLYDTYVLWKTLPLIFKRQGRQFVQDKLQIEDETILELCEISSQTEFAEKYKVHRDTLTDWNKLIKKRDEFSNIRAWLQPMLKNVVLSAYNVALKSDPKANADRRMLMEFAGWKPEVGVNIKVEGLNDLLREELRQIKLQEQNGNKPSGQSIATGVIEVLPKQS
jgi:hypothetical protein